MDWEKRIKMINSTIFDGVSIRTLKTHDDFRGFFREIKRIPIDSNELSCKIGQISHSEVFPGVVKAWHAHVHQYQWTYDTMYRAY